MQSVSPLSSPPPLISRSITERWKVFLEKLARPDVRRTVFRYCGVVAVVVVMVVGLFFGLKTVRTSQDIRNQAATSTNLVTIVPKDFGSTDAIKKIAFQINTQNTQLVGVQLDFQVVSSVQPTLEVPANSVFSLVGQKVSQTSTGYRVQAIIANAELGQPLSTNRLTDFLILSLNQSESTVSLSFDQENSLAFAAGAVGSDQLINQLNPIADFSLSVPVAGTTGTETTEDKTDTTTTVITTTKKPVVKQSPTIATNNQAVTSITKEGSIDDFVTSFGEDRVVVGDPQSDSGVSRNANSVVIPTKISPQYLEATPASNQGCNGNYLSCWYTKFGVWLQSLFSKKESSS